MNKLINFISENGEWLFSGLAITISVGFVNRMRAIYCKLTQEVDYVKKITQKNNYINQEVFFSAPRIFYMSTVLFIVVAVFVIFIAELTNNHCLQLDRIITGVIVFICQILFLYINRQKYDGISKKGDNKNYAIHILIFLLYYDILFVFAPKVDEIMPDIVILMIESGIGIIMLFFLVVHKKHLYSRVLIFTTISVVPIEVAVENIKATTKDLLIVYKEQNYIEIINRQYIRVIKAFK